MAPIKAYYITAKGHQQDSRPVSCRCSTETQMKQYASQKTYEIWRHKLNNCCTYRWCQEGNPQGNRGTGCAWVSLIVWQITKCECIVYKQLKCIPWLWRLKFQDQSTGSSGVWWNHKSLFQNGDANAWAHNAKGAERWRGANAASSSDRTEGKEPTSSSLIPILLFSTGDWTLPWPHPKASTLQLGSPTPSVGTLIPSSFLNTP